jgi:biopolymer transport protein ExbD
MAQSQIAIAQHNMSQAKALAQQLQASLQADPNLSADQKTQYQQIAEKIESLMSLM